MHSKIAYNRFIKTAIFIVFAVLFQFASQGSTILKSEVVSSNFTILTSQNDFEKVPLGSFENISEKNEKEEEEDDDEDNNKEIKVQEYFSLLYSQFSVQRYSFSNDLNYKSFQLPIYLLTQSWKGFV